MLEKSLGKNHAEVAEVLNSMGLVLKKRADYDGAEKLYPRSFSRFVSSFSLFIMLQIPSLFLFHRSFYYLCTIILYYINIKAILRVSRVF
jgi:hypothetical protein